MALNPPLSHLSSRELFPAPFRNEYFVLQRGGIHLELKDLPFPNETGKNHWSGRGRLVLSSVRAVFVAENQGGALKAFDIPLACIRKPEFNQPILACNNLTGEVWSLLNEGGPLGSLPPIKFKLAFTRGGVGTFIPLFFSFLQRMLSTVQGQEQQPSRSSHKHSDASDLVATALVDPNDPSMIYLAQPSPSAPPVEAPAYAREYGKDERYESMD